MQMPYYKTNRTLRISLTNESGTQQDQMGVSRSFISCQAEPPGVLSKGWLVSLLGLDVLEPNRMDMQVCHNA